MISLTASMRAIGLALALIASPATFSCIAVSPAFAQDETPSAKLRAVAEKIDLLMKEMAEKAEADATLADKLAQRKANIDQAEQNVTDMIARLTQLTDNMDDNSPLSLLMSDFEKETLDLVAEAEASNDDRMKNAIPGLRDTLKKLKDTNDLRSVKVQEARALIRSLEDNKKAIAFMYKVGQVQQAADQLQASVNAYASIVDGAQSIAATVMSDIAAR